MPRVASSGVRSSRLGSLRRATYPQLLHHSRGHDPDLSLLDIATDPHTDGYAWEGTLQLADRFGLTVYGAAYLELARRRALPLATLDEALRAAGTALGMPLLLGDGA